MSMVGRMKRLWRLAGRRNQWERGMDVEMRFHLEERAREWERRGASAAEARRKALIEFGAAEAWKDECREASGLRWVDQAGQDVRYAARWMRRRPGFTAAAVATLALGIGVNAAMFSILRTVVLKPLPYPRASSLVVLRGATRQGGGFSVSWPDYVDWRAQNRVFDGMAPYRSEGVDLTGVARPALLRVLRTSVDWRQLLGARMELGRWFTDAEDRPGAAPVVVLTDGFWRAQFGTDPNIVGRRLTLSGNPYTVIGVTAPYWNFRGAYDLAMPIGPLAANPKWNDRGRHENMSVLARMAPGVSIGQARSGLSVVTERLEREYPATNSGHQASVVPLKQWVSGDVGSVLYLLLAATGLVLAIACANLANLLAARASERVRELAVRVSLGAGWGRVRRQVLTESLVLAAMGGAAGIAVAAALMKPLSALAPAGVPRIAEAGIDGWVLAFGVVLTLFTGVLFGMGPAAAARRIDWNEALKEGGRAATEGRRGGRLRAALLTSQVALASLLVTAAMLLVRSLLAATGSDPGFDPQRLAALDFDMLGPRYAGGRAKTAFLERVEERLAASPDVQQAGASVCPPLDSDCWDWWYEIPGRTPAGSNAPAANFNSVDPGYFPAIGAHIAAGRNFTGQDRDGAAPVAIVNRALARLWFPASGAIGQRIRYGKAADGGALAEIVGVVDDIKRDGLDAPAGPEVFYPLAQMPHDGIAMLVRGRRTSAAAQAAGENAIAALDPDLPVRASLMTAAMDASLRDRRFVTILLGCFGALALLVAAVGIYGVAAYNVARRSHEIGVRIALGATTGKILALVLGHGLRQVAWGVLAGAVLAAAAGRAIQGMLYGVGAADPLSIAIVIAALAAIALLAAAAPARRALRLDPLETLRQD